MFSFAGIALCLLAQIDHRIERPSLGSMIRGGSVATPVAPLAIEAGFPVNASDSANLTTISGVVSTSTASLIVVSIRNSAAGGWTPEPNGVAGSTLGAFTQAASRGDVFGPGASVYYRASAASLTTETITVTWANAQGWRGISIYSFTGAAALPIGSTASTLESTTFPTVITVASTSSGSYIVGAFDNRFSGAVTEAAGTTVEATDGHGATLRSTATSPGGSVSLTTTAPATGDRWTGVAVEIKGG